MNEPSPSHYLTLSGGRLAYDDTGGPGTLVVAAPSMGDLRGEYRHIAPLIARSGYRIVTLDVRGQGQSSAIWNDYSAHATGRDVLALIEHLGVDTAVLIGTSFTAGSTLWAAHEAPAKIRGVVMIGPQLKDYEQPLYMKMLIALGFAGPWRVPFWLSYWDSLFPLHKPHDHDSYRKALAANLREPGRMKALKTMLLLSKADTAAILDQVKRPALIIMGSRDKDFQNPAGEAASLAAVTGAEVFIAEGAGHYPQVEMPEVVAQRMIAFLRRIV